MLKNIAYFSDTGSLIRLPALWEQPDTDFAASYAWWQGGYGLAWEHVDKTVQLFPGVPISAYPTPNADSVIVLDAPGMSVPNNAAIYNADGSLRFRLKAPKPLSRHWPGYVHTPEQIEKHPSEGFWQVGWNVNDFGDLCTWEAPYLMWANIGLHCDVYERRYFDPKTGEFDLEHYSTARR